MAWATVSTCGNGCRSGHAEEDICMIQGESRTIGVYFDQDIEDLVIKGTVRTDYQPAGMDMFQLTATHFPDEQAVFLKILPVDSSGLTPGDSYVYDIEVSNPDLETNLTFLKGSVIIKPQVTV